MRKPREKKWNIRLLGTICCRKAFSMRLAITRFLRWSPRFYSYFLRSRHARRWPRRKTRRSRPGSWAREISRSFCSSWWSTRAIKSLARQGRKYVPFFATFFTFILLSNLLGLLPGFAPPTGNLNTTIGLALCSFIGYNIIGVREQGGAYFKHFIGPMTGLPASTIIGKLAFLPLLLHFRDLLFYPRGFLTWFSAGFTVFAAFWQHDGRSRGDHGVHQAYESGGAGGILCHGYAGCRDSSFCFHAIEHDLRRSGDKPRA